ncbi:integrase [Vibrio cholerae]|nr:hypothetical protein [Vibrio cholerae]GIB00678.1 integrase [Vibrio cholerae]
MYLQKAPNGVYQTRICIPKTLRGSGYPFDIKVNLLTKDRSQAIERNPPSPASRVEQGQTLASVLSYGDRLIEIANLDP